MILKKKTIYKVSAQVFRFEKNTNRWFILYGITILSYSNVFFRDIFNFEHCFASNNSRIVVGSY